MIVFFMGVGGMALGTALVMLAARGNAKTAWIRALTGLAGLSALFSLAISRGVAMVAKPMDASPPFYLVILWGMVVGVWLIVSAPRGAESAARV